MKFNVETEICFDALLNQTRDNCLLLLTLEGTIVGINRAFTLGFGFSEEDIIGKNSSVLFTLEDRKKGLPEKELHDVKENGQTSHKNYLVDLNQNPIWVSAESVLVTDKEGKLVILKLIQNIQERKTKEKALRRVNKLNESILSTIRDVVIVLNSEMKVLKANNAFSHLFKNRTVDVTTLNFAEMIKPYDSHGYLLTSLQNAIVNRQSIHNKQIEIEVASGIKRFFNYACMPILDSGENHVLLILQDITIYKQLEKEREDTIGFIAHELRNPLSNLILCNELMKDMIQDNNKEMMYHLLERSNNSIIRLNKMIAQLYESTKVNAGYLQIEMSEFNFGDMIKEARDTVEVLQPAFNISVEGDTDFTITGDRYRLIQVVTNYLGNAIKYSNGKTAVVLRVQHDDKKVTVSVTDKGTGISKEHLPFVFERFFRVENSRTIEGIGLGLYLCRQIVHAHKGRVWAESEEGKGSTFYFSIPR